MEHSLNALDADCGGVAAGRSPDAFGADCAGAARRCCLDTFDPYFVNVAAGPFADTRHRLCRDCSRMDAFDAGSESFAEIEELYRTWLIRKE